MLSRARLRAFVFHSRPWTQYQLVPESDSRSALGSTWMTASDFATERNGGSSCSRLGFPPPSDMVTTLVSQSCQLLHACRMPVSDNCFCTSHCRCGLLWHNYVCKIAMGPVPHEGEGRPIRHCVPRCSLCKPLTQRVQSLGAEGVALHRPRAHFGPTRCVDLVCERVDTGEKLDTSRRARMN